MIACRKVKFIFILAIAGSLLSFRNTATDRNIAVDRTIHAPAASHEWIRINELGYTPGGIKVAVWVSKDNALPKTFELISAAGSKVVFEGPTGKAFGAYGPFLQSFRLNFSVYKTPGTYYLKCGGATSPKFRIDDDVYAGTADFGLRYLRQQRSGFNPFLRDSCHTHDGYTMYGPMPDSTLIDVSGGWHDATDYLQYVTTSANATYNLLAAYRDFPAVFSDRHLANGLEGRNGQTDVLDEAKWGLDWLMKMNPKKDWMFHQLADDRDHHGFRLPTRDSVDYGLGPGKARPVYFVTGKPQGLGKYRNQSTGMASAAGKFASAFALGAAIYRTADKDLSATLEQKSEWAYQLGLDHPGVCQTAPNREPYYYAEDNWVDDMELGAAALYQLTGKKRYLSQGLQFSTQEKVTPWMGADTARHYQWYPFHNFGHYELAKDPANEDRTTLIGYYKEGINRVWQKAQQNAFYRGVPFIWCSNNLNTAFAIQCYLYRQLSKDNQYEELEQACYDWLFGCNPWGTSMVYGLPADGNSPRDPHSSLSVLYHYPLDGAMVDGPVYGSIYRNLRGLKLTHEDRYAEFQSDYVVYHDDSGDYSTDEPTTDGTASLVYLMAAKENEAKDQAATNEVLSHGGIVRGDTTVKKIALVFTGDSFADGGAFIDSVLSGEHIHGSFFLTGNFYSNRKFNRLVQDLKANGNYLGSHSDKHLLYCDWTKRDSLLVTHEQFNRDLEHAYRKLKRLGIEKNDARYFLPPFEWYNDSIAAWTRDLGLQLVDFSPGTRSNADYTFPAMGNRYVSSDSVLNSIDRYQRNSEDGLNGFILLTHIGTDPRRTDKFYYRLPRLIRDLKDRGYEFVRIDELLNTKKGIPTEYMRDSMPSLVQKCKNLLDKAYMAQTLLGINDTLPGWEGYPVKLYSYRTGVDLYTHQPKTGKVYLLDPSPEKLAMWIATTCWEVRKSVEYKYTDSLFRWIKGQSGSQFPVKGVVYEDQYTRDFQEPYVFKDGVTVYVKDSMMFPKDKTCTPEQLDFYLHITNDDLKAQTGQYARIGSARREDYKNAGGAEDVGDINDRKQKWLEVVRELYKKAWNSDRNELLIMWARDHL
ncbi:MAG TPA: glycoside hydrolase family 9 protein [Puia sp.]|nr:glycoside hydrolase family 9 protein [Puia sp.]